MTIPPPDPDRLQLAQKRIRSILRTHVVATMRTLEQKISDAGPTNQRIDPHVLTVARNELQGTGAIEHHLHRDIRWYYLTGVHPTLLASRLAELLPLYDRVTAGGFVFRCGQTLEIAVYRALSSQKALQFFGGFLDLQDHDDATRYAKEEPPRIVNGVVTPKKMRLDFLVLHPSAGAAGIEAKNIREWLYPDRPEVRDLLHKCCVLDIVPVLIARRIAYSTISLLQPTGVLVHQTFNQLYPAADHALAELARHKNALGYHDVRTGNEPDRRLIKFVHKDLPALLPRARERFSEYADLLGAYGAGDIRYAEFAALVRRRQRGQAS